MEPYLVKEIDVKEGFILLQNVFNHSEVSVYPEEEMILSLSKLAEDTPESEDIYINFDKEGGQLG